MPSCSPIPHLLVDLCVVAFLATLEVRGDAVVSLEAARDEGSPLVVALTVKSKVKEVPVGRAIRTVGSRNRLVRLR